MGRERAARAARAGSAGRRPPSGRSLSMPAPAFALRKGDELDMYLATGKKKHMRVFWIDIGSRSVCWGKKR